MKTTKDFVRWLWSFLRNYKLAMAVAILGMLLFSLSNGSLLLFFREVMRQVFEGGLSDKLTLTIPTIPFLHPQATEVVLVEGSPQKLLIFVSLAGLAILCLTVIAEFLKIFIMKYVALNVGRDIRQDLYENMIQRPLSFFEERNVGDLMSRLSSDINRVKAAVTKALRDIIQSPLEILIVGGVALYVAPRLAAGFVVVPLCGYFIYKMGDRIKRYSRASQDVLGKLLSRIQEKFSGIKLIKAEATEATEIRDFAEENQKYFRKMRRKIFANSIMRPVVHLLVYGVAIGLLYLGGRLIIADLLHPADFMTFLLTLFWIYKPIRKITDVNKKIQGARGAAERINQVLDESRRVYTDLESGDKTPELREKIVFEEVTYSYPETDSAALADFNLQIEPGDNIAVVGPSGAGKSTFTDLLLRFYDPTEGELRLDGQSLPEYDLKAYRGLFGLVPQHTILFDASIEENIKYGRKELASSQVREAARQAEALPFIEKLSEGFETNVGEEGVKLSGGERQRLSLARALASEPQILVLDEATSSVDSQSEKMILKALEKLPEDMTLLTISHALATVQFVDRIAVLNNHRLEAVGPHQQLLEDSATYKQLYDHQVDSLQTAFG